MHHTTTTNPPHPHFFMESPSGVCSLSTVAFVISVFLAFLASPAYGTISFNAASELNGADCYKAHRISVVDKNGDGVLRAYVTSKDNQYLFEVEQRSPITSFFSGMQSYTATQLEGLASDKLRGIASGRLTSDTKEDLVVTMTNSIFVYNAPFTSSPVEISDDCGGARAVFVKDVNGDGCPDVVVGCKDDGDVQVFTAPCSGGVSPSSITSSTFSGRRQIVEVDNKPKDIDFGIEANGEVKLVVGSEEDETVRSVSLDSSGEWNQDSGEILDQGEKVSESESLLSRGRSSFLFRRRLSSSMV